MTAPKRIQQRRTKGWRKPEGAVAVGRQTKWGNPFRVERSPSDRSWRIVALGKTWGTCLTKPAAVEEAVELFALHTGPMGSFEYDEETFARLRAELAGKDLMCWCPLPEPGQPDHCHAAVLIELANTPEGTS